MKNSYVLLALAFLAIFPLKAAPPFTKKTIPAPSDVAAPPADAETTASGLASRILRKGTGTEHPTPDSVVKVDYTGWKADGTMIDSSVARGEAVVLPLSGVIPGWREGLALMTAGEVRRLWIPEQLAYNGHGARPEGMRVFDVELLEIVPLPKTPPDVASIPAGATVTRSGLASRLLAAGSGAVHPKGRSRVTVQYTGWTTTGQMFDSSFLHGKPSTFQLNQVIPGWTEGLQSMVEGERRRFWIPEKLAYKGVAGMPAGMLVFDVELLKIE